MPRRSPTSRRWRAPSSSLAARPPARIAASRSRKWRPRPGCASSTNRAPAAACICPRRWAPAWPGSTSTGTAGSISTWCSRGRSRPRAARSRRTGCSGTWGLTRRGGSGSKRWMPGPWGEGTVRELSRPTSTVTAMSTSWCRTTVPPCSCATLETGRSPRRNRCARPSRREEWTSSPGVPRWRWRTRTVTATWTSTSPGISTTTPTTAWSAGGMGPVPRRRFATRRCSWASTTATT